MRESESTLPEWYQLANASAAVIEEWLTAQTPDYIAMRRALPWLNDNHQLASWLIGVREARTDSDIGHLSKVFRHMATIPLPPLRAKERHA